MTHEERLKVLGQKIKEYVIMKNTRSTRLCDLTSAHNDLVEIIQPMVFDQLINDWLDNEIPDALFNELFPDVDTPVFAEQFLDEKIEKIEVLMILSGQVKKL